MSNEAPKTYYVRVKFEGSNTKIYSYRSDRMYPVGTRVVAAPFNKPAICFIVSCSETPDVTAYHWLVGPAGEAPRDPGDIDVSGTYPLEKLPKLLEAATRIVATGECKSPDCSECPCYQEFHASGSCVSRHHGNNTKAIPAAWFEKFIEEYDRTQLGSLVDIPEGQSVPMELHPEFNVVGTLVSWGIPRRGKHYLYEVAQVKGLA